MDLKKAVEGMFEELDLNQIQNEELRKTLRNSWAILREAVKSLSQFHMMQSEIEAAKRVIWCIVKNTENGEARIPKDLMVKAADSDNFLETFTEPETGDTVIRAGTKSRIIH